jgi:protein phosphatase
LSTNEHSAPDESPGFRVGTRTHIGLRRKRNEDFLDVRMTPLGLLVVVCDGMGGPGNGDRASRLAVEAFVAREVEPEDTPGKFLRDGVERANRAIIAEILRSPEYSGMGTTLVAALLKGSHATVANVGDSRAYRFGRGSLTRISRDHSFVADLVERGEITEEEAAHHPRRNIITRALGSDPHLVADIFDLDLVRGEWLLLATDGLHGMISDAEIAGVLGGGGDPAALCDQLVERALMAGGSDNVTVALVGIDGGEAFREVPTDPGDAARKGSDGRRGRGILVGLVVVLLLAAAWLFWPHSSSVRDEASVTHDSLLDSHATVYDSSGWIDMGGDAGDSVHPGDAITW